MKRRGQTRFEYLQDRRKELLNLGRACLRKLHVSWNFKSFVSYIWC